MKVQLLPAAVGEALPYQHLTSFLIDDALAIDAGSLGFFGTPDRQARIRHVLLTHAHLDHLASLPMFLENVYQSADEPVTVWGQAFTLDCLRRDLFNDRLFPDFLRLSGLGPSFLRLAELRPEEPVAVAGWTVTPVAVDHLVPTLAFAVSDGRASVLIVTDTGPTDRVWELARATPNLRAVFLEATFPDELSWLAEASKHLTPSDFAAAARRVPSGVPVLAVHLKPRYREQVSVQLQALGLPTVLIARPGYEYQF